MHSDLALQRQTASKILLCLLLAHVPLNAIVAGVNGMAWIEMAVATFAILAIAFVTYWQSPSQQAVRITLAIAYMAAIGLLLAAMKGQDWQVDVHMYFFAALALIAMFCDWRAIVAATLTVAVHHLSLNFLLPSAVYPGGADLARVILHAVILVIEAAGLVWMTYQLSSASNTAHAAIEAATNASKKAEDAASALRREAELRGRLEQQRQDELVNQSLEQKQVVDGLAAALARLAQRDLTYRIETKMPGAYQSIARDFNSAADQLRDAISGVAAQARSIARQSEDITSSADALSKRTEQNAASLEETAAALDEITATGRKAAQGAMHARTVVSTAEQDAIATGTIVHKAVSAMGNIEASAHEINTIIGVIDEIAFQTNLLALNAGVEAARAGDAGRGFAVVASEVRALAQRSAEAAKQIKGLISKSAQQVAQGVELVAETGTALKRILSQVEQINSVVIDIAAGAEEQATGLQQINTAINQMDQTTQQNAAMVEEATAVSHALKKETQSLSDLVAVFQLGAITPQPHMITPNVREPLSRPSQAPVAPRRSGGRATVTATKGLPAACAQSEWADF
jgi:methyl-accepting chemotaxis protein